MALGDGPKTVALHDSAWVPERQERLTRMFKKAYRRSRSWWESVANSPSRCGTLNEREASNYQGAKQGLTTV